tara:strand:+ start:8742 stop:9245 length:504 start_codon:yes stop_codon:yes gene_type:complete
MSVENFDSTFDFAALKVKFQAQRGLIVSELATAQAEIALYESASAYGSITAGTLQRLNRTKTDLDSRLINMDAILAEVDVVTSLSLESKDKIYYYYTILTPSKTDFMVRTLFNHVEALANGGIESLRADEATPLAAKVAVAQILYAEYNVKNDYATIINLAQYMGSE